MKALMFLRRSSLHLSCRKNFCTKKYRSPWDSNQNDEKKYVDDLSRVIHGFGIVFDVKERTYIQKPYKKLSTL